VIADFLSQPNTPDEPINEEQVQSVTFAIDLLNKCILGDNFKAKDVFDANKIYKIIPTLWIHENRYINLFILKFYKSLLYTKFNPYKIMITKQNLMD
jgi:hypothetical protein